MTLGEIGLGGKKRVHRIEDAILKAVAVGADTEGFVREFLRPDTSGFSGWHAELYCILYSHYPDNASVSGVEVDELVGKLARGMDWTDDVAKRNILHLLEFDVTDIDLRWCVEEMLVIAMQRQLTDIIAKHAVWACGEESLQALANAAASLSDAYMEMAAPWGDTCEKVKIERSDGRNER